MKSSIRQRCAVLARAGLFLSLSCLLGACVPLTTWTYESGTPPPRPTTAVTTGVTSAPTQAPTATATPTSSPSPAPTATITPLPTPTPVQLDSLDNTKTGWYYQRPSPTGQAVPAAIPAAVAKLIAPYRVVWQIAPQSTRTVYLTMDEGYEYQNLTDTILDVARDRSVPITFFITGSYLKNNPQKVLRMVAEGHQVANHTWHHPNLVDLLASKGGQAVLDELTSLEKDYLQLTGQAMIKRLRPPEGSYSERLLALLTQHGYETVFWSFAYRDWLTDDQPEPQAALARIVGEVHDGSVLLLHAVSATNVAVLPELIDAVRAQGFTFALLP
jgi:delta-lactam-biosynthetic de-N-acetylase